MRTAAAVVAWGLLLVVGVASCHSRTYDNLVHIEPTTTTEVHHG